METLLSSHCIIQHINIKTIVTKFCLFIFEREREKERQGVSGGGAEREGDTEFEAQTVRP